MSKESLAFDGRDWDTLGERGNLLAGEGWRYARTGNVRHKVVKPLGVAEMHDGVAVCGLYADWYGTGSQAEYERLAGRPKCLRCMAVLGERDTDDDTRGDRDA